MQGQSTMRNISNPIINGEIDSAVVTNTLKGVESEIHLKTLRYVDYFAFLWFYSHGKIKLFERKTASLLHASFNKLKNPNTKNHNNGGECKLLEEAAFSWKFAYITFMGCMQRRFSLPLNEYMEKSALGRPASFDEFCKVETLIKREPEGLLSVWDATRSLESAEDLKDPVVANVAPFITRKAPTTTTSAGNTNAVLREQYERNRRLYSQCMYPLDILFEKDGRSPEMSEELRNDACKLASSLFEIICYLFDSPMEPLSSQAEMLASHIEQLLVRDTRNDAGPHEPRPQDINQTTLSIQVKDYLNKQYGAVIKSVSNWTPFPTCFWLIGKHMQNAASEQESNGALDKIRQKIVDITESLETGGEGAYKIIQRLYKSNVAFIITRLSLVHPRALEFLYASIVNSGPFYQWLESGCTSHYIDMTFKDSSQTKTNVEICMQKLNVLRSTGIAGTRNFLKIKCLHAHLAYSIAQEKEHANLIEQLIAS